MATKSSLVSGMGVAMSLVQTLVGAVKKAGGSDEDIHLLVTLEADGVWDKIATLIVEAGSKVGQVFNLVVDYTRSLKDSIVAGRYNWVNDDITEEHFPSDKDEQSKKDVAFRLFHFNRDIESDEAIRKMEEEGCRPATIRELLVFGEANPEIQRQFPIIALKSVWVNRHGDRDVASLGSGSSERDLDLCWFVSRWHGGCRFLAVSK